MQKTAWWCLPQTVWDYHKVGMYIKERLIGFPFSSRYLDRRGRGTFFKMAVPVFPSPQFWLIRPLPDKLS